MQQLHQLTLPLLEQGLGREDEDGPAVGFVQGHEECGHGQLHRFAEADLIGEHEAGTPEAVAFQREAGEVFLVGPEALVPAVDGGFDGGSCGGLFDIDCLLPIGGLDDAPRNDPLHILRDERAAGEIDRAGVIPERVKLFRDPGDRLGAVVFPEQFVVQLPG